jgi:hypothetical protein
MRKILYATVMTFMLTVPVMATPPENADPAMGPFFKSLKIPGTDISCCDTSDCRPVKIRVYGDKLQIFTDSNQFKYGTNEWVTVPPSRILEPRENLMGEPIACWTPYLGVMCFLNGAGM